MQASTQPASFRSALASVFSDVFESPSIWESNTTAESSPGSAFGPDEEQEQQQDQSVASVPADPYATRVAHIKQKYDADAAAAIEQQQQLQHAAQQAKQRESEALGAADSAYTPAWRQAGLPAKASQFAADAAWLAGAQLLNPAAIMQQQEALQQKEVLHPPAVFEYCDKKADPHYLTATNNLKVRQAIAFERIAAAKSQRVQSQQWNMQWQQQQQMPTAIKRSTAKPQSFSGALACASMGLRAAHRSIPWSQLPQEEVSQKVAASAARHKALAGIMTPEQRESEERIIKSMYQKLSFLRNPRYPMSPAAAMLQNGLQGTSSLRRQQQKQRHNTTSRPRSISHGSKSSCGMRTKAGTMVSTAAGVHGSCVDASDVGFCVVPAAGVLFDAYEPGGVYFQTVQLQNVGDVIKGVRLLPPASCYFQVSLPRYPSAANELAPGMAAEVSVCFTPDTLGDYSDAFVVETVLGRFEVSLRGSRPHPTLTLGEECQFGDVLVGNSRSRTIDFVNKGGAGRFLVLSAADWGAAQTADGDSHPHIQQQQQQQQQAQLPGKQDSSNHRAVGSVAAAAASPRAAHSKAGCARDKKAAAAAAVALEPEVAQAASGAAISGVFAVSPTFLSLPPGASGRLTVNFSPDKPGQHTGEFVLICDNCTVRSLRIIGRGSDVDVQLVALDGRQLQDQDKQAPIWFGEVNPGCSCFRKVTVQNSTQLPFPYRWQVDPLQLPASARAAPPAGQQQHERVLEAATAAGAAPGAAEVVAAAAGVSLLTAQDVSAAAAAAHTSISVQADCMTVSTQQPATSTCDSSSSSAMRSGLLHGLQQQQQQQQHQAQLQESGQQHAVFSVHPRTGVLQPGEDAEFTVEFTPSYVAEHAASAVLYVERSGDALMTAMHATGGRSGRSSTASQSSSGTSAAAAAAAAAGPQAGSLYARCTQAAAEAAAAAAAADVGSSWESVVLLGLEGLATPVRLEVAPSAVVQLPGQLTVGDAGQQVLTLRNNSAAAAHFSFESRSSNSSSSSGDVRTASSEEHHAPRAAAVSIEPASGVVPSYESVEVTAKFTGQRAGVYTEHLLCRVAHGAALPIVTKASVVEPVVMAAVPVLDFGIICFGSSHTQQLRLHNMAANCSTHWQLAQIDQEERCLPLQVQLLPSSGCLEPAAEGTAAVTVTGRCNGSHKMLLQLSSSSSSSSSPCQPCCFVQVIVTVSEPCLVLDTYKIRLKPTYLGVQQRRSITVTNTSRLPLRFSWTVQQLQSQQQQQRLDGSSSGSSGTLSGTRQEIFSPERDRKMSRSSADEAPPQPYCGQLGLSMSPAMGHLDPQQSMQVQLLLEPTQVGPVTLLCCCVVPNMSQPAGFLLTAVIEGLQMAYEIERPVSQGWLGGVATAGMTQGTGTARQLLALDGNRGAATTAAGATSAAAAAAPLLADFGVVAVHQVAELQLRVTNLTSIDTTVRAWVSRYPAAAAGAAVVGSSGTQHPRQQQQQQQLGGRVSSVQPKASSQLGQLGTSQSGKLGSSLGHVHGLPISMLPALPAPVQQQQVAMALGQPHSRSKTSSPQQQRQTISPQQRQQQQQQPSLAARLAAAVSGSSPAGPFTWRAANMSSTIANSANDSHSGSGCGGRQLTGTQHMPGPFRSAAGNSMMAARKVAAAAAEALGEGHRGCAVRIQPHSSDLPGSATVDLQLVAYNNLPGTYIDYVSVQVGDLPVKKITLRLSVVGSPLVLSRERVLLQGLQMLKTWQHAAAGLGVTAAAAVATAAAAGSSSMSSLSAAGACSRTCDTAITNSSTSNGNGGGSSSSSIPDNVAGATTVQLPLGAVPVGLHHERRFFVVNTGALPMQLTWQCSVQDQGSAPAAAAEAAADAGGSSPGTISFLPMDGAVEMDSAAGLSACSGSSSGMHNASVPAAAADTSIVGSELTTSSAAIGTKGRSSKAGSSAAGGRPSTTAGIAATAAAATAGGAAATAKSNSGSGAAKAAAAASVSGGAKRTSGTGATSKQQAAADDQPASGAESQQQQQQQGDEAALHCTAASTSDAGSQNNASAGASAATTAAESGRDVPEYEQLLPSGGPSGLLKTLQAMAQYRKQQQQQQGLSSAAEETSPDGTNDSCNSPIAKVVDGTHALEAFLVDPQQCVLPAGQQQEFTVSFCSWHSGNHSVNLIGKQVLAAAEVHDNDQTPTADSAGEASELTVMLWPRQQEQLGATSAAAVSSSNAAAAAPVELILSGGFHAYAAPPLVPMPNLQVALSATAVEARLTPSDPSCLVWSCCSIHDPGSHGSYRHTVTLCNTAGCPLVFQLETEGPFKILSATPSVAQEANAFRGLKGSSSLSSMLSNSSSSSSANGQQLPTDIILLPPGESVDATLLFTPPAAAATADTSSGQQQQQYSDAEYAGALVIKPTNGRQQHLPLSATVVHPGLTASPARLDYGLVHPSAPRPLELLLTNPTRVDASWHAQLLPQPAAAGSSSSIVFWITPDHGVIPGRGLGMPETQRVTVTCSPVGNLAATAELRLLVDRGSGCSVKLQGQGTFDEGYEHLAILKDM